MGFGSFYIFFSGIGVSTQGLGLRCSALPAGPDSKQGLLGEVEQNNEGFFFFNEDKMCIPELQEQREQAVCAEGGRDPE